MNQPIGIRTGALVIGILASAGAAFAGQWEDEMPIVQDPVFQHRSWISAAPDDALYVLWLDWTDWEDTKVFLIKGTDKGHSWSSPALLADGTAYDNAEILATADAVHVLLVEFFEDANGEYLYLYHTKSTDGGATFSPLARVGSRKGIGTLRFFEDGSNLYIYARDNGIHSENDYLYVSPDGGTTWQEKDLFPGVNIDNPGFAVRDGVIHMAYCTYSVRSEIEHTMSLDAGDSWTPPVAVSQGAGDHSQLAAVAVDDQAIHVAWEGDRQNHFNVMYSRSTDGGKTWSPDVRLNDTFYGARVQLLADEEGLHAVWCQYHGDNGWPSTWSSADYGIIWYKLSNDGGANWSDEFRVSQNAHIPPINLPDMGANYVRLVEYGTGFCAMWQDKRDGNIDLYLRNNFGLRPGDLNCDGEVDFGDINPFVQVLTDPAGWQTAHPYCDMLNGDINGDTRVDFGDINPFVSLLTQP